MSDDKIKKLRLNGYNVNMINRRDGIILTLSGTTKKKTRYSLELTLDNDYYLGVIDKAVSKMAEEKIQRKEEEIKTLNQAVRK